MNVSLKIQKNISILLITSFFLGRVVLVAPVIYADDPAPTRPPVPTSAPASTSAPAPTSPPNGPKPTYEIIPTLPVAPTNPPLPTNPPVSPQISNTVDFSNPSPYPTSGQLPSGKEESNSNSSGADNSASDGFSSGDSSYSGQAGGNINDPANIMTGPFSTNSSSEILDEKMEVLNKNLAELQNKIDAVSSTGFNYANLNTLDGQVFTSDSVSTLNLLNKLNSNIGGVGGFSVFDIYDTYFGDIVFQLADPGMLDSFNEASTTVSKNSLTGPGSSNNADASNTFTVKEANGNDAEIINDIVLESSTGNNSASGNTGGGTVKTGDALALGNIVNLANTNINVSQWLFGIVNIWGTLVGDIILPKDEELNNTNTSPGTVLVENENTGPMSSNSASYQNSETASFENINSAEVTSNLDVSANTGNNSSSVNTGGGSVTTGMADAAVQNTTIANTNTVNEEGTVWMVIVNEAGKWVGHILGDPWGASNVSNSLPFTTETAGTGTQSFSTVVQNSGTGPSSSNEASFSQTSDSSLSNENSAVIVNNIKAGADSGNNEASYNTGAGQIETGDAKVGLNMMNMVNTNVVAKKFVAVFVNVLGTFLGNVIPPDQQEVKQTVSPSGDLSGNVPQSTPQPQVTATPAQLPSFTSGSADVGTNIGSILPVQNETSSEEQFSENIETYISYQQNYYYSDAQSYPSQYSQAVDKVSYASNKTAIQKRQLAQIAVENRNIVNSEVKNTKRGLFLSPAFAKATETSFAGMLLGGASLRVNNTWLSIIPITLVILFLRRRRNFNFTKYLNLILEIIL